jgi:hypothetical protein
MRAAQGMHGTQVCFHSRIQEREIFLCVSAQLQHNNKVLTNLWVLLNLHDLALDARWRHSPRHGDGAREGVNQQHQHEHVRSSTRTLARRAAEWSGGCAHTDDIPLSTCSLTVGRGSNSDGGGDACTLGMSVRCWLSDRTLAVCTHRLAVEYEHIRARTASCTHDERCIYSGMLRTRCDSHQQVENKSPSITTLLLASHSS